MGQSFDTRIHDFYNDLQNIYWLDFKRVGIDEAYYDYYYAEDELYLIRDRITEAVFFTEARSPKEALDNFKEATNTVASSGDGCSEVI